VGVAARSSEAVSEPPVWAVDQAAKPPCRTPTLPTGMGARGFGTSESVSVHWLPCGTETTVTSRR
jgi:hypothetical protein